MIERHIKILDILARNQRIEVAALADMLKVSKVTVRKDLAELEDRGILHREHGAAAIGSVDDVGRRMAYHYEVKRRIAQAAAELVEEGETVIIESGSCCALLAEELTRTRRDITVITNSAFIANHIRLAPHGKIILLGGDYQAESQVMVGPITRKCVEGFYTDKLFIGADGFIEKSGFTGKDHMRAETVRDMAKQARRVVILTESEKFFHQGVVPLMRTGEVSMVYTDDRIPPEIEGLLTEKQVIIHKVPAAAD
ncbi:MAG: DeoR/GlpR family DNA-binding transcription regulator [Treponema sp.]|jgi:DeoR/GlpR family transcriptional regulator of sugar metabolism|nr:DeoR/GlpR family DNA-binding transcription regulator [Treponema sp.]